MPAEMPVPPEVPIVKFFSPSKNDRGLIEFHNSTVAAYQPLDEGAVHPNSREYPGYKLGKQFNLPNDHKWIVRIWVTDQVDPTWWNWAEKFSADANSYPIFIREYREPRETYAPLTKGQPLKSIYRLTLDTAGSGYTVGTLPEVTFSGGAGSGAAGHAVVAPDGTIAHLVLDDGGDGYTSSPTITIEAPPTGGTTATGTAVIQPATALLVAEEAQQYPEDSEFFGLYVHVVRVYETLPGPTIPYTRFDDNLGPVQGTRQAVLYNDEPASLTATGKTTYEARDGSSIVAWKIVEAWTTGAGTGGNPVFPSQQWTEFERDGVKKVVSKKLTPIGSIVTTETNVGGVFTRKYSAPYNEFLAFQIIETITVDDADFLDQPAFTTSIPNLIPEIFRAQIPTHVESHIIEGTAAETALTTGEFEHSERQLTPLYKEVRSTVLDDISLPVTLTNHESTTEFGGGDLAVSMTLDDSVLTIDTGPLVVDSSAKNLGNGLYLKITRELDDTGWPILYDYDVDEETGQTILSTYQVVDASTATTATISSGVVTRYKHIDKWRSLKIIATHSTPASYDEQRFGAHNFPALVDITTWSYSDPGCGTIVEEFRGGFSAMVQIRVEISFTTSKQTFSGLTLIPKSFILGRYVQLPADMLVDGATLLFSGDCSGSLTYTGSDPDYSTYVGSIQGTEQLITGESVKWKAGLYKNTAVYVTML